MSSAGQDENPDRVIHNGGYKIAGVVVNEVGGAPLERARVTIVDARNRRNTQSVITGDGGHFEFDRLPAGKFALQGARRGFIATSYNQHQQFSTAIVAGPSFETDNLVLRLVPAAIISGKVLDEAGEPVRNANVKLYRENHNLGFGQVSHISDASTDDRGYYDFWPVIPGTYYVSASASPWYAVHPSSPRSVGGAAAAQSVDPSLDVMYPETFFSDATDSADAAPISILGGDHPQIDINLWPIPCLHLFFHSSENDPNGFTTPTFLKRVFGSVEYQNIGETHQLSNDTFELSGVPLGTYTVRVHHAQPGAADQTAEVEISQDGQKLDLSSGEPLGSVTLSVKIPGQSKLPPQLFIGLRDSRHRAAGYQSVNANGEAHFENLAAGKYTLAAGSPEMPYSVLRIASPDAESPGGSFDLAPGASLSLTAFLVGGAAKVEGVAMRSGKPAAGMMVVLVPADPESNIQLFRRDQSDLDGSFLLRNVIPGAYTVIAIEDGWSLDWSTPAVLARYTPRGEKITVPANEQGTVRLPAPVEVQPR